MAGEGFEFMMAVNTSSEDSTGSAPSEDAPDVPPSVDGLDTGDNGATRDDEGSSEGSFVGASPSAGVQQAQSQAHGMPPFDPDLMGEAPLPPTQQGEGPAATALEAPPSLYTPETQSYRLAPANGSGNPLPPLSPGSPSPAVLTGPGSLEAEAPTEPAPRLNPNLGLVYPEFERSNSATKHPVVNVMENAAQAASPSKAALLLALTEFNASSPTSAEKRMVLAEVSRYILKNGNEKLLSLETQAKDGPTPGPSEQLETLKTSIKEQGFVHEIAELLLRWELLNTPGQAKEVSDFIGYYVARRDNFMRASDQQMINLLDLFMVNLGLWEYVPQLIRESKTEADTRSAELPEGWADFPVCLPPRIDSDDLSVRQVALGNIVNCLHGYVIAGHEDLVFPEPVKSVSDSPRPRGAHYPGPSPVKNNTGLAAGVAAAALWLITGALIGKGIIAPGMVDFAIALHTGLFAGAMVLGALAMFALVAGIGYGWNKRKQQKVVKGSVTSRYSILGDTAAATFEPEHGKGVHFSTTRRKENEADTKQIDQPLNNRLGL